MRAPRRCAARKASRIPTGTGTSIPDHPGTITVSARPPGRERGAGPPQLAQPVGRVDREPRRRANGPRLGSAHLKAVPTPWSRTARSAGLTRSAVRVDQVGTVHAEHLTGDCELE